MMNASKLVFTPEVTEALREGRPVVALESTLIAHGLPWPVNLETARQAEQAVRDAGAVPATIAVLDGRPRVGLDETQLERLARSEAVLKAGRRDLPMAAAREASAATTVSATLWIAQAAGIGVFATGGLGGVHRGASETFDISQDLDALAQADGLAVICSGAKAILDLPATLEALETRGVPIIGHQTDTLPAFTCRSSGLPLDHRADSPTEAAAVVEAHRRLELPAAVVIAQPVPEADALDSETMDAAIDLALEGAQRLGISGRALTPFLLDRIHRITGGASVKANTALILANATLAGAIAHNLASRSGPKAVS